jgi:hypothetical protein
MYILLLLYLIYFKFKWETSKKIFLNIIYRKDKLNTIFYMDKLKYIITINKIKN